MKKFYSTWLKVILNCPSFLNPKSKFRVKRNKSIPNMMETIIQGVPIKIPENFLPLFFELTKQAYFKGKEITREELRAWIDSYKANLN